MNSDLLFDTPWWLPVAIALVGFVLLFSGNARQKKPLLWSGLLVVLLAIALTLTSWFVDTDVEKAIKNTKAIVQSVDQKDWTKLKILLSPQTSFAYYKNRDELVSKGQATAEKIGLKKVHLTGTTADQLDSLIRVNINVISEQELTGNRPLPTSWRFTYQDFGKGWILRQIEPLPTQLFTPDMITRELVRP